MREHMDAYNTSFSYGVAETEHRPEVLCLHPDGRDYQVL